MLYKTVLFVHILGALIMFMGVGITMASMAGMLYSRTVEQLRGLSTLAKKADGLLPFSVILILLPGLYLVFTSWGWGQAWVNFSLILLVVMTIMGPTINLRRIDAIDKAANEASELTVELMETVKNKVLWTSMTVMTMLALAIVFLMTLKTGLIGSLIAIAAAILLGFILSSVLLRKGTPVNIRNEVNKHM